MSKPQFYLVVLWIVSSIILIVVIHIAKLSTDKNKSWEERQFNCLEAVTLDALAIMTGLIAAFIEFVEGYYILFIGSLLQIAAISSGLSYMIRAYIVCKNAAKNEKT